MTVTLEIASCVPESRTLILGELGNSQKLCQTAESMHVSRDLFGAPEKTVAHGDIVIVDDTAMNILVLEQMIRKKLRRNCSSYSSGAAAISGLRQRLLEEREGGQSGRLMVLMDVNMPMMSGAEATRRIRSMFGVEVEERQRHKERRLVIIAATGQEREDV